MATVRAKEAVYLAPEHGGYHAKGDEFAYDGPENENLEPIEEGPYYDYSVSELKDELTRRSIGVPPQATKHAMSELLVGDDSTPTREVKPRRKVKDIEPFEATPEPVEAPIL